MKAIKEFFSGIWNLFSNMVDALGPALNFVWHLIEKIPNAPLRVILLIIATIITVGIPAAIIVFAFIFIFKIAGKISDEFVYRECHFFWKNKKIANAINKIMGCGMVDKYQDRKDDLMDDLRTGYSWQAGGMMGWRALKRLGISTLITLTLLFLFGVFEPLATFLSVLIPYEDAEGVLAAMVCYIPVLAFWWPVFVCYTDPYVGGFLIMLLHKIIFIKYNLAYFIAGLFSHPDYWDTAIIGPIGRVGAIAENYLSTAKDFLLEIFAVLGIISIIYSFANSIAWRFYKKSPEYEAWRKDYYDSLSKEEQIAIDLAEYKKQRKK